MRIELAVGAKQIIYQRLKKLELITKISSFAYSYGTKQLLKSVPPLYNEKIILFLNQFGRSASDMIETFR